MLTPRGAQAFQEQPRQSRGSHSQWYSSVSKGRSGQCIIPGSQPLSECDNDDNVMAAAERLVLIGKLSKSQRNELDLREKVKEQETRLLNMRYENSGLHLTILKQEKIISALEREVSALKGAMDLKFHRSSRRRSSTTKGKKAVLEDELKAFRSVVWKGTYLSMWTKKQRS